MIIQAPLDALEMMLKRRPIPRDEVREIVVRMSPGSVLDNCEMPDVCIQHMLAVMLLDQTVTFASAHHKPRMRDAAVLRQRAKVQSGSGSAAAGDRCPGRWFTPYRNVAAVRGTNANPMTREEVMVKARGLMTPVLGAPSSAKLIEATLAIESMRNVHELRPLLQRG